MAYIKPNLKIGQYVLYVINRTKHTTYEPYENTDGDVDYTQHVAVQKLENSYIPISFYDGQMSSRFSVYNEQLQIKDNAQCSLSFSVAKFINNELNPFFYLMVENRRLRLQTYEQKIDFIITSIQPQLTNSNVIYNVTCQDTFSYDLSKQDIAISYNNTIPEDISVISNNILYNSKLGSKWKIDPTLESGYYADFPSLQQVAKNVDKSTHKMRATIEIKNSTVYNALVTVCKKFNASLYVDYSDADDSPGIIYFQNKIRTYYGGYTLRSDINLNSFSVSRKSDNFCSVMHVSGGVDADNNGVSICPAIPPDVQKYFIMLFPQQVTETNTVNKIMNNTTYPYCVIQINGNCVLYKKTSAQGAFLPVSYNYVPWTDKTANEIRKDFNSFPGGGQTPFFATAGDLASTEYFNFLEYRSPSATSLFYDFDYFLEAGLMDQATYDDLNYIFSHRLRNANIILSCVTYQYNTLNSKMMRMEALEEEAIAKLCALEEESYSYHIDPEKTPKSVLTVVGEEDNKVLTPTTIDAVIDNERISVLTNLLQEIWTEDYYRTLFTLRGNEAINGAEGKLYQYKDKLAKKELQFQENYNTANVLLDSNAPVGAMILVEDTVEVNTAGDTPDILFTSKCESKSTPIPASLHAAMIYKTEEESYELFFHNDSIVNNTVCKRMAFQGAVLNTLPTIQKDVRWPDDPEHKDLTDIVTFDYESTEGSNEPGLYRNINLVFLHKDGSTGISYTFKPFVGKLLKDRETYLADTQKVAYTNYAAAKKRYVDTLKFIRETPATTDRFWSNGGESMPTRRGLYAMYVDYLTDMIDNTTHGDLYGYHTALSKYAVPFNLHDWLISARKSAEDVWRDIYRYYGDYIIETTFADDKQLSNEGLFMAAMQSFAQYSRPACEYSTTVIDSDAILDLNHQDVHINDMVYLYNNDISSEYSGKLKIHIPSYAIGSFFIDKNNHLLYSTPLEINATEDALLSPVKSTVGVLNSKCKLYCRKANDKQYQYIYGLEPLSTGELREHSFSLAVLPRDEAIELPIVDIRNTDIDTIVYLECPVEDALRIMAMKSSIDTLENLDAVQANNNGTDIDGTTHIYTDVLDIEMDRQAKPIPLQVTSVSKKLRNKTTQISVSTDRTMDIIFSRLVKQARL